MKRDARIGMAVVLVLGLSVMLLAGRALYKRGAGVGEMEGEVSASTSTGADKPAEALTFRPRVNIRGADSEPLAVTPPLQQATPETPLPPMQQGNNSQLAQHDNPRMDADHESTPPSTPETRGARSENNPRRESAQGSPAPRASGEFYAYTVAAGDNPWKISSKVFGDGKYTQKIVDANGGMDTLKTKMKTGSVIKIPQLANKTLITLPAYADGKTARAERAPASSTVPAPNTSAVAGTHPKTNTYKIERGDTLTAIAKKNYGSTSQKTINAIIAANKGLDANSLKAGQEITLPKEK